MREISIMDKSLGQGNWISYQGKEQKTSRVRKVEECQNNIVNQLSFGKTLKNGKKKKKKKKRPEEVLNCLFPLPYPTPWNVSE